jgi:hypothetical protein
VLGPIGALPLVIRTWKIRSTALAIPKKEKLPLGTVPGNTAWLKIELLWMSKNSIDVLLGRSTSVNIAPKPVTVAGCEAAFGPGMKKPISVTLLPIGEISATD